MPWSDWIDSPTRTIGCSVVPDGKQIAVYETLPGWLGYDYSQLRAMLAACEEAPAAGTYRQLVTFPYMIDEWAQDAVPLNPHTTYKVTVNRAWIIFDAQYAVAARPVPDAWTNRFTSGDPRLASATTYEYEWAHATLHEDTAVLFADPLQSTTDGRRTARVYAVPPSGGTTTPNTRGAFYRYDHLIGQYSPSGAVYWMPTAPTNPDQLNYDTIDPNPYQGGWPTLSVATTPVATYTSGGLDTAYTPPANLWDNYRVAFTMLTDQDLAGDPIPLSGGGTGGAAEWGTDETGNGLHLNVNVTAPRWRYFSPQVPPLRQVQRDDGLARSVPRASRGHSRQTTPRARGYL